MVREASRDQPAHTNLQLIIAKLSGHHLLIAEVEASGADVDREGSSKRRCSPRIAGE